MPIPQNLPHNLILKSTNIPPAAVDKTHALHVRKEVNCNVKIIRKISVMSRALWQMDA